ncbi:MAG TPA: VanW family protein [Mycobacteriales bacterium]|nr:VanW family protein [Mycobacteriales bacterium]
MPRRLPLIVAAVSMVGAVTLAFVIAYQAADRTAPEIRIGSLPAGNLDRAALEQLLTSTVSGSPDTISVTLGRRTTSLSVDELGVELDVRATAQRALEESGRSFWRRSGHPPSVKPAFRTDPDELERAVATLVHAAQVPESHGALQLREGRLVTTAPADGQHVDPEVVRDTLQELTDDVPWPPTIAVQVEVDRAHVSPQQLQTLAARVSALVDPPVHLSAGARRVVVPPEQLVATLSVADLAGTPVHGITLELKPAPSLRLAEGLARELGVNTQEPKVEAAKPTALLRARGNASWRPRPASTRLIERGVAGQEVPPERVLEVLRRLVAGETTPSAAVPVTTRPLPPRTLDAEAARIDSVLGTFTTPFACCQPRVRNITLMAKALDGLLIAPGEQLSLNRAVGRRTTAKGYVDAPFILEGELSTDIGGGVSQVATTMLNAAFFAGLQLDRHQAHSFYISRYPPGREATLNYPTIDIRWTNDSAGAVLVRTTVTSTSLTVSLYGVNDGRTVTGTSGPRRPVPGKDFRITITRTVSRPGVAPVTSSFTTTYNKPPEKH